MKTEQCQGYRRYGGAFTLGPVKWEQCKELASVKLKVIQDGKVKVFPACMTCWEECLQNKDKIEVLSVRPLAPARKKKGKS